MGTTVVAQTSTALVLTQMATLLGPEGEYEKRKIALKTEYAQIVASAEKITAITTPEEAQEAANHGRLLQAGMKEMETFFKTVKQKCDAIKNPILADEKAVSGPLDIQKKRLGVLQVEWDQEIERQDRERQRLADEAAKKQAEDEALERALNLAASGDEDAANAVLDEPVVAAPVVIQSTASRPTGSIRREYRKCKVVNFKALVAAVAAGTVPIQALEANQSFLDNQADRLAEAFAYPGCELETSVKMSYRA